MRDSPSWQVPCRSAAVPLPASLVCANLFGRDLRLTDLRGRNLYQADLGRTDLRGARMEVAVLYGAQLRGANLANANLRCADLRGADLRQTNTVGADFRGALYNFATLWPDGMDPVELGMLEA